MSTAVSRRSLWLAVVANLLLITLAGAMGRVMEHRHRYDREALRAQARARYGAEEIARQLDDIRLEAATVVTEP